MNTLIIEARELQVGDTILHGGKETLVQAVETGPSCLGVHVNILRKETHVIKDGKGKAIGLNPDRGRILHSDGCYAPCAELVVRRVDNLDSVLAANNDSLVLCNDAD